VIEAIHSEKLLEEIYGRVVQCRLEIAAGDYAHARGMKSRSGRESNALIALKSHRLIEVDVHSPSALSPLVGLESPEKNADLSLEFAEACISCEHNFGPCAS